MFGIVSETGQWFLFQLAQNDQNPGNKSILFIFIFQAFPTATICGLDDMRVGKNNLWFSLQKEE